MEASSLEPVCIPPRPNVDLCLPQAWVQMNFEEMNRLMYLPEEISRQESIQAGSRLFLVAHIKV